MRGRLCWLRSRGRRYANVVKYGVQILRVDMMNGTTVVFVNVTGKHGVPVLITRAASGKQANAKTNDTRSCFHSSAGPGNGGRDRLDHAEQPGFRSRVGYPYGYDRSEGSTRGLCRVTWIFFFFE